MIKRRHGHPIRKLSHHITDKFGKLAQSRVSTVTAKDRSVSPPHTVTSPTLPDTRAQILLCMDLVHKLGDTRKEPFPVTSCIKVANSEGLKLVRGLLVTVSATGFDGNNMRYISENIMTVLVQIGVSGL